MEGQTDGLQRLMLPRGEGRIINYSKSVTYRSVGLIDIMNIIYDVYGRSVGCLTGSEHNSHAQWTVTI